MKNFNEQIELLEKAQLVVDKRSRVIHQLRAEFCPILQKIMEKLEGLGCTEIHVHHSLSLAGESIGNENYENIGSRRSTQILLEEGNTIATYPGLEYDYNYGKWEYSDEKNEIKNLKLSGMIEVIEVAFKILRKKTESTQKLVEQAEEIMTKENEKN